ncbi:flagellar hook-basal body complex protein FliE [bacterium CPR1]|nr:flagellar hook-basal body complex protein FliE [bacterium CPR1]
MQQPFSMTPIGGIGGIKGLDGTSAPSLVKPTEEQANTFASLLGNAINTVNTVQDKSKKMTQALATGNMDNIHEMTIAGAKAEVAMKMTTTIASKLATATTTLFQMQL